MKPIYLAGTGFLITVALIAGVYGYHSLQSAKSRDYVLPHDNFNKQTMDTIRAHLTQYNVMDTPQDHEVYMVTGGLGFANPRIMEWDSGGDMNFWGNDVRDPMYSFRETSQSPANWYTKNENGSVSVSSGIQEGFKPVPWLSDHTKNGVTYYNWDMIPYRMSQFYFKKGNTYIILRVDYISGPGQPKPTFPQGLPSHLVSIGNPVIKKEIKLNTTGSKIK